MANDEVVVERIKVVLTAKDYERLAHVARAELRSLPDQALWFIRDGLQRRDVMGH